MHYSVAADREAPRASRLTFITPVPLRPRRRGEVASLYTILVVDDNRNIRDYCRRELTKCAYRVLVAQNGREALVISRAETPDLVVLDVRMPGMDGLQTLEELHRQLGPVPVVFHTAFEHDLRLDERSGPACACVVKSRDLHVLKSVIARVLAEAEEDRSTEEGPS